MTLRRAGKREYVAPRRQDRRPQQESYEICGLALAVVAIAALLGWEALHGGIQSHHLLADPSMPSVSNAWGLLSLPAVAAVAAFTVARRARGDQAVLRRALMAWGGALLVGVALAASFSAGYGGLSQAIALAGLFSGLYFRTYRAEIAYGFTLGMMAVVGPVLPLIVVTVAGTLSALAHFLLWPLAARLWRMRSR